MHPLALACARHHVWLVPVSTRELRTIRNGSALSDFVAARLSTDFSPPAAAEVVLVEGALWAEQLLSIEVKMHPPSRATSL